MSKNLNAREFHDACKAYCCENVTSLCERFCTTAATNDISLGRALRAVGIGFEYCPSESDYDAETNLITDTAKPKTTRRGRAIDLRRDEPEEVAPAEVLPVEAEEDV